MNTILITIISILSSIVILLISKKVSDNSSQHSRKLETEVKKVKKQISEITNTPVNEISDQDVDTFFNEFVKLSQDDK